MITNGWISVTERLPEYFDWVLVTTNRKDVDIGWIERGEWERLSDDPEGGERFDFVTHWMPLPTPAE